MMKSLEFAICPMCERQAVDGITHTGCRTRFCLDGLISFYRYDGPVKAAIKRLKYKPYLSEFASILIESIINNAAIRQLNNNYLVVPVPLHPQRERERGFNQASFIGKAIAGRFELSFQDHVMKRVRNTKPQVELKGDERRKNVVDAFILNTKYKIRNTSVLLVDDVWTTGSTLRSCANVLKRAGAEKVCALTVAR